MVFPLLPDALAAVAATYWLQKQRDQKWSKGNIHCNRLFHVIKTNSNSRLVNFISSYGFGIWCHILKKFLCLINQQSRIYMILSGQLIMVVGLPGTGKTYFAQILSESTGAWHLNSDKVRYFMGLQGQYNDTSKAQVYQELLERAEKLLKEKHAVIVDATLYKRTLRQPYIDLANKLKVPIFWIEMQAHEAIVKERVSKKRAFSEADFTVYKNIKTSYEPLIGNYLALASDRMSHQEMISKTIHYLSES